MACISMSVWAWMWTEAAAIGGSVPRPGMLCTDVDSDVCLPINEDLCYFRATPGKMLWPTPDYPKELCAAWYNPKVGRCIFGNFFSAWEGSSAYCNQSFPDRHGEMMYYNGEIQTPNFMEYFGKHQCNQKVFADQSCSLRFVDALRKDTCGDTWGDCHKSKSDCEFNSTVTNSTVVWNNATCPVRVGFEQCMVDHECDVGFQGYGKAQQLPHPNAVVPADMVCTKAWQMGHERGAEDCVPVRAEDCYHKYIGPESMGAGGSGELCMVWWDASAAACDYHYDECLYPYRDFSLADTDCASRAVFAGACTLEEVNTSLIDLCANDRKCHDWRAACHAAKMVEKTKWDCPVYGARLQCVASHMCDEGFKVGAKSAVDARQHDITTMLSAGPLKPALVATAGVAAGVAAAAALYAVTHSRTSAQKRGYILLG